MKNRKLASIEECHPDSQRDSQREQLQIHPISTAPTEEDAYDLEASAQAEMHREHAQNLVREHLEHHVSHNPGASSDYVTWIATLHPENAEITIDQRFFVPGNPWWSIYEDTKNNELPVATAVPVSRNDTVKEEEDVETPKTDSSASSSETKDTPKEDESTKSDPHCCQTCNPIASFVGFIMTIVAFMVVLTYELVALFACHLPATIFYQCAQAFAPPNICTCLLYFFFMIFYGAFHFADSILLLVSVFATECVGMAALLMGFLTGGCLWAKYLHQHIRKMCHGIRAIVRQKLSAAEPTRGLCCGRTAREYEHERQRKANRDRGVTVVNTSSRREHRGESYH